MAKLDIYQAVTDRILELLDRGTVPWHQPFQGAGFPVNLASGKPYRGINTFLLATTAMCRGYRSPYWLTFKQANAKGGQVRKGEKSSLVVFWKKLDPRKKADPNTQPGELSSDDLNERFVLRHYRVFNTEQCDGLDVPAPEVEPAEDFSPIEAAERIAGGFKNPPAIEHGFERACYGPKDDAVRMPNPERFGDPASYYATLFHELTHATGHSKRLDRGLDPRPPPFGTPDYSKEELVAEMGAAFLSAAAGISPETIEQSAAYIDGWRKKLRDDKKLVVQAAGSAQRAADHILGVTWENTSPVEPKKKAGAPPPEDTSLPKTAGDGLDQAAVTEGNIDELFGPSCTAAQLAADLQTFPRPGQSNLNSTATSEQRSAFIGAVLGWWNDHVDQWVKDDVLDPSKNPTVYRPDTGNTAQARP